MIFDPGAVVLQIGSFGLYITPPCVSVYLGFAWAQMDVNEEGSMRIEIRLMKISPGYTIFELTSNSRQKTARLVFRDYKTVYELG